MPVHPDVAADLQVLGNNPDLVLRRAEKLASTRKLIDFMDIFWPVLHPGQQMIRGWALEAWCDHLEGVHYGHIQRLLGNVPPGFSKSISTNVFFPAWEWGPRNRPELQYLSSAYGDHLTQRDNEKSRMLMGSPEYQIHWGHVFQFDKNTDGKVKFMNTKRGFKEATSVGGASTGGRADRLICDDPHNVLQTESDPIRRTAVKWFLESWASRTNNERAAFLTIMQRVHEDDVAAACIELGYTHLCIPMHYESDHPQRWFGGGYIAHDGARARVAEIEAAQPNLSHNKAYDVFMTQPDFEEIAAQKNENAEFYVSTAPQYGKGDPRTEDDELAFPELFSARRVAMQERQMAKEDPLYAVAGQMQQRPSPRGGGVVKEDDMVEIGPDKVPEGGLIVCGYDLAGSAKKKSPYTCAYWGKYGPDGVLYILGRKKDRVESDGLDEWVTKLMEELGARYGKNVLHSLPQDPGQAGKYQKRAMIKKCRGFWVKFSTEVGDKESRAKPMVSQIGARNTRWVRGPHMKDAKSTLKKWPAGKYKDDMDALSRMDMTLTQEQGTRKTRLTQNYVRRLPIPYDADETIL